MQCRAAEFEAGEFSEEHDECAVDDRDEDAEAGQEGDDFPQVAGAPSGDTHPPKDHSHRRSSPCRGERTERSARELFRKADNSPAEPDSDGLGAVADLQLADDALQMGFDRVLGDAELVGEFLVAVT